MFLSFVSLPRAMPPKGNVAVQNVAWEWTEERLKTLEKGIRSLVDFRAIIWEGDVLGIFSEEFRSFLVSKDEFLEVELEETRLAGEQYLAVARSSLCRPLLLFLREQQVGPLLPVEMREVALPLLSFFGGLFLWAQNRTRPTCRPREEFEALLSTRHKDLKGLEKAKLGEYRSPLAPLVSTASVAGVKRPREEVRVLPVSSRYVTGTSDSVSPPPARRCFICQGLGHFAAACPKKPEARLADSKSKVKDE